jgi:hypothetical protein
MFYELDEKIFVFSSCAFSKCCLNKFASTKSDTIKIEEVCTLRISKTDSQSFNSGGAFTDICCGGIHPGSITADILLE